MYLLQVDFTYAATGSDIKSANLGASGFHGSCSLTLAMIFFRFLSEKKIC